jgi:hypothetical protein
VKTRTIGAVALTLGFLLCGGGAIVVALMPDVPPTSTPLVTPAPRTIGSSGSKAATGIAGDDIVQIGVDVPAGTYRAAERLSAGSLCYWAKTRDAEGDDIIDNDIPAGGRPQVTLQKGQWFTTRGCPAWEKR